MNYLSITQKIPLAMRVTLILLCLIAFQLQAEDVYSQKTKISLDMKNASVEKVLQTIEEESDYFFLYNNKLVNVDRKVSVRVKNAAISDILDKLFASQNVEYQVEGNQIILSPKEKAKEIVSLVEGVQQQQKTITGKVTDSNGEPIIGANIIEVGTTNGTVTDIDGNFTLDVSDDAVLRISFIGYIEQNVNTAGKNTLQVVLQEDTKTLEEVVVVGYGTQKKVNLTGSVASVKGNDIIKIPTSSITNTLIGQIPGLIANNRSGEPGYDDAELLIRGRSTTGDNSPLVVVDGVADRAGGFSRIDPNDIESISILKDASAAIYGSRAANGVILVTTKHGSKGKIKVNYSMNYGLRRPTVIPEMSESWQYAELLNEIQTSIYGRDPMYTQDQINLFKNGSDPVNYPNVNALKQTLKDWSPQTLHNLSISGGNDFLNYFVSVGYQYNNNYYKNSASYYDQYNFRSNVDINATKNLTFHVNLAARQEDRISPYYGSEDIWRYLVKYDPRVNIVWPGTNYPVVASQDIFNPITAVDGSMGYQKNKTSYFNGDLSFELDLPFVTNGLSLAGGVYIDRSDNFYKRFQKAFYLYEKSGDDYIAKKYGPNNAALNENMNQNLGITANIRIDYKKTFNQLHNLNALVAYEQYQSRYDYLYGNRQDFVATIIDELFAGDQTTALNDGTASETARQNYFGRLDYNFAEKYLFQFNWRYDGSENFPKGKRFGFFPGVSGGWRISEENFWREKIGFIDYFKLRGSWGQMGNDRIAQFQYMTTYTFANPAILGGSAPEPQTGVWKSRSANPNVTWEVATTTNVGFDSHFLEMFTFNFDFFQTKRKNILATRNAAIPEYSGLTLPDENIGKAQAKGYELELGFYKKVRDFNINASANYSYTKNKITYIDEPAGTLSWQAITDKSIGANWLMYQAIGIFRNQEDIDSYPHLPNAQVGDLKFNDVNDDKTIDGSDQIRPNKTSTPEIIYGINLNLGWKQFSLSTLWQGAANIWQYIFWESGTIGNFTKDFYKNHWTENNPNAPYPRVYDRQATVTGLSNTFWLKNASYLRLKNIELSYTLPHDLVSRWSIENLRLYISGYNLITFSRLKDTDPETTQGSQGFAAWSTPQSKVLNFGLNLSF
jgi:TonB-linked SusC/RagA family outer membrane protein